MNIVNAIMTNNPCYTCGTKLKTIKGLMLHSVGCSQPSAAVFAKKWNVPSHDNSCVHAFIDANNGDIYQTLPWDRRGWHCGNSGNNTHIGVEMCEPAVIKYTGGAKFTCSPENLPIARNNAMTTYNAAVELFAYLCNQYCLNPLEKGVIVSHNEGYKLGIASGHADPEHLWTQLGLSLTMDKFRLDVAAKMNDKITPEKPAEEQKEEKSNYKITSYKVQFGPFSTKLEAAQYMQKLTKCNFGSFITSDNGKIKVQCGSFSSSTNAENLCNKLHNSGFKDAFIYAIYADGHGAKLGSEPANNKCSCEIKVGDRVRVLKNTTYTGGTFKKYYDCYDVLQVKGDRVVIGKGKIVTCAIHVNNIQKI